MTGKRQEKFLQRHSAAASWRTERNPSVQLLGLQPREGRDAQKKVVQSTQEHKREGVLFQLHHPRSVFRGGAAKKCEAAAVASLTPSHSGTTEGPGSLQRHQQQETGQSVQVHNVNSSSLSMFKVATAVQEIMIDPGQKKKR
jgi:hypothetical protein